MSTQDNLLVIHQNLQASLERQADALPEGFNRARFVQNCMTVLQENPKLANCNPRSVVRTLLKGSFLGLDFFMGECYAIPYDGDVKFQTDYKGEIKVCKRFSTNKIRDIYAKVVRQGDAFEETVIDGRQTVTFRPLPFNDGPIVGAFAVVYYEDGSMLYDTMSVAEIEATRKAYSKAANSTAWKNSYGEMCKKTVLRRLCKLIDLDFSAVQKESFDEGGDAEFDKKQPKYEAHDIYAEEDAVEDAEFEEVTESAADLP